jgi:hypothetical protein
MCEWNRIRDTRVLYAAMAWGIKIARPVYPYSYWADCLEDDDVVCLSRFNGLPTVASQITAPIPPQLCSNLSGRWSLTESRFTDF